MNTSWLHVCISLLLSFQTYFQAVSGTTYNFHDHCSGAVALSEVSGELIFTSTHVHTQQFRSHQCNVTVSPKHLANTKPKVMFYFTEFDIGRRCRNNNLTVIDGTISKEIDGLPDVLCGHNTSLENSSNTFTSTESEILLQYRWSDYGERFTGSFKLTFISFYDGPCQDVEGIFSCSNDRCISTEISCSDELNYCGNGDDSNCHLYNTLHTVLNSVLGTLKDVGIIVAVCIGIAITKICVYDRCKARYGSVENFPILSHFCKRTNNSSSSSTRNTQVTEWRSSVIDTGNDVEADQISLRLSEHNETAETTRTHTDDLPSYDTFSSNYYQYTSPESGQPPEPSAPPISSEPLPPPSYEDVVANSDKYVKH